MQIRRRVKRTGSWTWSSDAAETKILRFDADGVKMRAYMVTMLVKSLKTEDREAS
jgi:hypothetical protein